MRVTHKMGYPLKPGIAVIASNECFACGTHGHNGRNCPMPPNHQERLMCKEAAWRAIVSKVLGPFNQTTAIVIVLVFCHTQQPVSAWIEEIQESNKGKGNGST